MMKNINQDKNRKKQYRRIVSLSVMVFFITIFFSMPMVAHALAPTAPTVTGTAISNSNAPTWTWTAGGGGNGSFRRSFDNATWTSTSALTYTPTALAVGTYILYVQETDGADWSSSGSFTTVINPVTITSVTAPADGSYKEGTNLDFTVTYSAIVNVNLPLDRVTGAAAAYGLRKLKSDFTGSAIRVRRSSDDTEQDIGFSNGELNSTALTNFLNANLLTNPTLTTDLNVDGIADGTNKWPLTGATYAIDSGAQKITNDGTQTGNAIFIDNLRNFSSGQSLNFSVYAKVSGNVAAKMHVEFWNASNQYISSANSSKTTSSTFAQITWSLVVPANTNQIKISYDLVPNSAGQTGSVWFKDAVYQNLYQNAYVSTWYDQSGNGKNMTQTTAAKQPQICTSGALIVNSGKPALKFDGSTSCVSGSAVLAANNDYYTYNAVFSSNVLKTEVVMEQNSSTSQSSKRASLLLGGGGKYGFCGESNDTWNSQVTYSAATTYVSTMNVNNAQTNNITIWKNGTQFGPQASGGGAGNLAVGNYAFAIGYKITANAEYFNGYMSEAIVYPTALTDTNRKVIEYNQGEYYGITGMTNTEPTITLDIGGTTKSATYLRGSGTTTHTYRYTVEAGLNDTNGIGVSSPISGGTNKDIFGTDATLTFTPPTTTGILVDTTAPTNTTDWPLANTATNSSITIRENINEAGTAYYVVVANGATTPTAAEVVAGVTYGAVSVNNAGNFALTANTEGTTTATGLTVGTQYDVYVVAKDTVGNLQASPTKVDAATYAGGAGTAGLPWQVKWPENLNDVRTRMSTYYIQIADIDISMYSNWMPIGTQAIPFTGTYNGSSYKITNLTINRPTMTYVGLFGFINAILSNIYLENVNVTGNTSVGALVGRAGGNVTNCYSKTGSITSTGISAGGLFGYFINSTVTLCYSNLTVTGAQNVGGLAGINYGATSSKCYATGNVTSTGGSAGGLFGLINTVGSTTDCYATGNVTSSSSKNGGLVGLSLAATSPNSITRCYATGTVTGASINGALVGQNDANNTITDSYALSGGQNLVGTDSGTTTGSSLKSAAQLKQQATFSNWDFASNWAINEGATYPVIKGLQGSTVSSVTLPSNGSYKAGVALTFTLNFSNNITLTGTSSTLALTVGSNGRTATYASKTANSITYSYTVQTGETDTDGISLGVMSLNGDTLVDASALTAYASYGPQTTTGILVDTTPPTAPTVTAAITLTSNVTPTWTWTAGAGGNGSFRVGFDNVTWTTISALTYTPTALSEGSYTLYVEESDAAGNWSPSGNFTIVVDTTAPTAAFGTDGAASVADASSTVTFADADGINTSTMYYYWDTQNSITPLSGWVSMTTNPETISKTNIVTTYYLWVKCNDNAGNNVTAKSNAFITNFVPTPLPTQTPIPTDTPSPTPIATATSTGANYTVSNALDDLADDINSSSNSTELLDTVKNPFTKVRGVETIQILDKTQLTIAKLAETSSGAAIIVKFTGSKIATDQEIDANLIKGSSNGDIKLEGKVVIVPYYDDNAKQIKVAFYSFGIGGKPITQPNSIVRVRR